MAFRLEPSKCEDSSHPTLNRMQHNKTLVTIDPRPWAPQQPTKLQTTNAVTIGGLSEAAWDLQGMALK